MNLEQLLEALGDFAAVPLDDDLVAWIDRVGARAAWVGDDAIWQARYRDPRRVVTVEVRSGLL